jgi:hypothetical protein
MAKKTIAAQHIDWLELVEIDGPFLTLPVLCDKVRDGLIQLDGSYVRRELREQYERWQEKDLSYDDWVNYVLVELLGYDEYFLDTYSDEDPPPKVLTHTVAEYGERLAPSMLLRNPDEGPGADEPQMLIMKMPEDRNGRSLSRRIPEARWSASPISRMAELLRATGIRIGLVTDGEQWTLVDVPTSGDDRVVGTGSWLASDWDTYEVAVRSFVDILGQRRFFSLGEDDMPQVLLKESRESQYEVTDQLGLQVRRAVEILVRALDRADKDANGALLEGISDRRVYQSATSLMMRLVVLLCAEERELLPLGDPLFDAHYAVSTLGEQLREKADELGDEVLERSYDAWPRLLAAFRAIYAGIDHDRLQMSGYGGAIFDPDRFPFLEGRGRETNWESARAEPIKIHNRTVLHVLDALQYLKTRIAGHTERRKLTFKALGVEQIGHVYEGLLDHAAERYDEPVLGLIGTKAGEEAGVKLSTLDKDASKSPSAYHKALSGLGVGSVGKIKKLLDAGVQSHRAASLRAACGDDEALWKQIEPYAPLIRDDDLGDPLIIPAKSIFVTSGIDRRATGTHYTPRQITEPIVEKTLDPQVYEGPAEGEERDAWRLKLAPDLLDLKVCDPACGSGAFLVATVRYLGDRLVDAWAKAEEAAAGPVDTMGEPVTNATEANRLPKTDEERVHLARRLVAGRCIYGVDKNPAAIEMAKLSLWLLVLAKDEPFGFLDHAIKSGDSLVGLTGKQISQMTWEEPETGAGTLFAAVDDAAAEASARREELEAIGVGHEEEKQALYAEAEQALADAKLIGDVIIAAFFGSEKDKERKVLLEKCQGLVHRWKRGDLKRDAIEKISADLQDGEHPLSPFHWELEFSEVFVRENSGFDSVVGNPPFLGVTGLASSSRNYYTEFLRSAFDGSGGKCDLVAFFFRLASEVLRKNASYGLVGTKTVAQGDTRRSGLSVLKQNGLDIYRATKRVPWPGKAAVIVSFVHGYKGSYRGAKFIHDSKVRNISCYLLDSEIEEDPKALVCSEGLAWLGSKTQSIGFVFSDRRSGSPDSHELSELLRGEPASAKFVKGYVGGEDLMRMVRPEYFTQAIDVNHINDESKLADFPQLKVLIKKYVWPSRKNKTGVMRRNWWKYGHQAHELYEAIDHLEQIIVIPRNSDTFCFCLLDTGGIVNDKVVAFTSDDWTLFTCLQSRVHEVWARGFSATLKDDLQYTPTECVSTWPVLTDSDLDSLLAKAGQEYYEFRSNLMIKNDEGPTKTYNRFHDPDETDSEIVKLRELHAAMDRAVLDAYGWDDISTDCEFIADYEVEEGKKIPWRYRWPEDVRDEVLGRLLELNQKRYEEEVAQGLHDTGKGSKKKKTKKKTAKATTKKRAKKASVSKDTGALFGEDDG